ncbi:MAG: hypothetical protein MJB14_12185 [Spirochaetes bacterium]|nr:hypothetical protein [Spirochaetota bacterium]
MKKIGLLLLVVVLLSSCISSVKKDTEKRIKNSFAEIKKLIKEIEKQVEQKDVEPLVQELIEKIEQSGKNLSDFVDSTGKHLDENWLFEQKKKGWLNDLKYHTEKFVLELKEVDSEQLIEYGKQIKKIADRIGKNILETLFIMVEHLEEKSIEYSKSDIFKALKEIWK